MFYPKARQPGSTVIELIVACFLLGLLLASLFLVYRMVAGAWYKTSAQSEMLGRLQVISGRFESELEQSNSHSVSISADHHAISFLSAIKDGVFVTDLEGRTRWQSYVIYYYLPSNREIYRREVPLSLGDPEVESPGPIEDFGPEDSIDSYLSDGRSVMKDVTNAEFSVGTKGLAAFDVSTEKKRYGREEPETGNLSTTVYMRN